MGSRQPNTEPIVVDLAKILLAKKSEQVLDVHWEILEPEGRKSSL